MDIIYYPKVSLYNKVKDIIKDRYDSKYGLRKHQKPIKEEKHDIRSESCPTKLFTDKWKAGDNNHKNKIHELGKGIMSDKDKFVENT
jgi:hypothetical protein